MGKGRNVRLPAGYDWESGNQTTFGITLMLTFFRMFCR